jgi:transaldolase
MDIYMDSASVTKIRKWLDMGVINGVTTNPSIMFNDGVYDAQEGAKKIAALINPMPLSVEVTTNDLAKMLDQAHIFASWAPNIVVKIPQETQDGLPCYGVIHRLEKDGIRVNATAALSLGQVILAAKAGASYISIFVGRLADEGGNAPEVIRNAVEWLEHWNIKSKIIIGSIRSVADILTSAVNKAHIITIPPQFLDKMSDHKYTRDTVRQFTNDAAKAIEMMMEKVKVKVH